MSADQRYLSLTLFDGYTYEELQEDAPSRRNRPHLKTSFSVQEIHFDLSSFNMKRSDESIFRDYFSMLNLKQLKLATDSLETAYAERDRDIRETMKQFYRFDDSLFFVAPTTKSRHSTHRLEVRGTHSMQTGAKSPTEANSAQHLSGIDTHHSASNVADTISFISQQNVQLRHSANLPGRAGLIIDSMRTRGDSTAAFWAEQRRSERQTTHTDSITLLRDAVQSAQTLQGYSSMRLRELEGRRHMLNRHYLEIHRKFSLSFACFLFFLIGAPLGALIRRGGLGLPMLISILLFLIYHVITMSSEKLARDGVVNVQLGMWISSIILLPAGLLLTLAANREGRIPLPRWLLHKGGKKIDSTP
jgi:hypothetical protein